MTNIVGMEKRYLALGIAFYLISIRVGMLQKSML
jgi:hypothetical protein